MQAWLSRKGCSSGCPSWELSRLSFTKCLSDPLPMPVFPLKPFCYTAMHTDCEICHSTKLKVFTRRRYFIIAGMHLVLAGLLFYIRLTSAGHDYLSIGLSVLILILLVAFIRALLLAALRSEPTYKCQSCGYYDWLESL